jgi:YD repeat-containing protein
MAYFAAQINAYPALTAWGISAYQSGASMYLFSYNPDVQAYSSGSGGAERITITGIRNGTIQLSNATYNSTGLLTQSIDAQNRTLSYVYASNNIDLLQKLETAPNPTGFDNFQLGAWTWNSAHCPLSYTDGSGQVTHYTYNSSNQVLTITDANSNVTTMTYTGTSSATISGTITVGDILTLTVHDAALSGGQQAISYTVATGNTLTNLATGLKNAINANTSLQAIGVTATSSAAVVTMKSTSVNVTTYTESTSVGATETIALGANTFGFLTKIDGPMPGTQDVTTFTYDGYNRLYTVTDSEGYTLTFSYDNMNRLTKTAYPDGTSEQTVYFNLDAVMTKDRLGRWTQDSYDSIRQLAYEIDPLGRKTQYVWCTCGSLTSLTDPNGHITTWQHDLQGRVTE